MKPQPDSMQDIIETGHVLSTNPCPGGYTRLRIAAPEIAGRIRPGHYLRINGRSWTVMRATVAWVEYLQHATEPPPVGAQITMG
jgi:hypothetical protein